MLDEIFHQIDSAMVTISKGIDVDYYERKLGSNMPNTYSVKLCLPEGKDSPSTGDVMLLSARKLVSRDQILKDNSFCTILVVTRVCDVCKYKNTKHYTVWMDVLQSKSPHKGSLNRFYQVMHLANLSTEQCSWKAMTSGFKDTSGVIDLILSKSNNGVSIDISLFLSLLFFLLFLLCTDSVFFNICCSLTEKIKLPLLGLNLMNLPLLPLFSLDLINPRVM